MKNAGAVRNYRAKMFIILGLILLQLPSLLSAADEPVWSTPMNLSEWQLVAEGPVLEQNENGTAVVSWAQAQAIPITQVALMARIRSPSGTWGGVENVSGYLPISIYQDQEHLQIKVEPDGTVWMIWVIPDGTNFVIQANRRDLAGSWHKEILSSPIAKIRNMDLHIGPDGDLGLTWVACSTTSTDYTQGPCRTYVRRRSPMTGSWEAAELLEFSGNGMAWSTIRVGAGGKMVANWARLATTPPNWEVQGSSRTSSSSSWTTPTSISQPVEPNNPGEGWISAPVMGADGTTIISWYHKNNTGTGIILKSSTWMAGTTTWTPETPISGLYSPAAGMSPPILAVGLDGTALAAWARRFSGNNKRAVLVNVREPGGTWSGSENMISSWRDYISLQDVAVLDDGRGVVLWTATDNGLTPKDEALFWSHRPRGGTWNGSQVSGWIDDINGAALAGLNDDSGYAVWIEADSSLPVNEAYTVYSTGCSFVSLTCAPAEILAGGYKIAYLGSRSVYSSGSNPQASVSWFAQRYSATPTTTPTMAMWFAQWPKPIFWPKFYPAMTGAGRGK